MQKSRGEPAASPVSPGRPEFRRTTLDARDDSGYDRDVIDRRT